MRRSWLGFGLSAIALVAACSAGQRVSEGIECRSPQARAGMAGVAWSEPIEVARGPAHQGPWRMNDSDFRYVDDATVAIDDGRVVVAWVDQARRDIFLQVYDRAGEATFEAPVNVSRSPGVFSWLPRLAITAGDRSGVYVVWQELVFSGGSHGGEIFFARSSDAGRSFDTPVNLSDTIAGDGKGRLSAQRWDNGSLDVVVSSGREIHVAWTDYEGALWYRRSTDGGRAFTESIHVAGNGTVPARAPSLGVEGDSVVHLAWTDGEDPAADVRLVPSTDGGIAFGSPTVVGASDGHADAPKLAVDGEGTVHLVYAESDRRSGGRYHLRYTRRSSGDDTFEAVRVISCTEANGVDSVGFPSLSVGGGDGSLHVVWERFPTRRGRPLGLGFAHSADGGRTFGGHAVVPGTADIELGFNGSLQGLLTRKLAVAEDGAIAVVNSSFRQGELSLVRLIRGRVERAASLTE